MNLDKIDQALTALGIDEYVVSADAVIDTEEKFNNAFRKIVGKDEHDSAIEEYVVRADAVIDTEEKFNNAFRKIIGKDEHDSAIEEADPSKFGVTWSQVKTEMDKL